MSDTIAPGSGRDFDWINDPDIVQRECPAVAIYTNTAGQVVIRQERSLYDDDDLVIRIDPRNAARVAQAIIDAAAVDPSPPPPRPARHRRPDPESQPAEKPGATIPGLLAAE